MTYDWQDLSSSLFSVYVGGDGKTLWAVGERGTILHTTDGATWKPQASGTSRLLLSVYGAGDGKTLWAVGERGTILHTTDGATWKPQASGTSRGLRYVYGNGDGKTLWAVGDDGAILHTTDGATWKPQTSGTSTHLHYVYGSGDGKTLWAVGERGTILHATDGATWKPQISGTSSALFSVYGSGDGKTLWAVGERGTILHTTDGTTWKPQTSGTSNFLACVYGGGDGKTLWVVGDNGTILHTTDGTTWKPQTSGTSNFLVSLSGSADGKTLWAVGAAGTILNTTDGATWKPQANTTEDAAWKAQTRDPSMILSSLSGGGDGKTLWAVGEHGTILHTTDGAATWKTQTSGTSTFLLSVYRSRDGKTLWAVGQRGTILHTTDGATWKPQTSGISTDLWSVSGSGDGKALWAAGDDGKILHTTDGATWKPQTSGTLHRLRSVYVSGDGKTLWAVGDLGTILHTTDGATWKPQTSGTSTDLWSVSGSADGKALWAVGGDGKILHSTDGSTWEFQTSGTSRPLRSVYVSGDGKTSWTVGSDGTILYSTDGETWKPQISGTSTDLWSVYVSGDGTTLWAVGEQGAVLRAIQNGHAPYIEGADFVRMPAGPQLKLRIICPEQNAGLFALDVTGRNQYKFKAHRPGSQIASETKGSCGVVSIPVDLADLEMGAGDMAHFEITLQSRSTSTLYRYAQVYDPWRWFIDHRGKLGGLAVLLSVFATLCLFLVFRPLWNLRIYLALKQAAIDKLFRIPVAGPFLELIFGLCTFGLPWFVTHVRTLDAWVAEHRSLIERHWGEETLPARAAASERQRAIEATPYVPLPLRIGDPSAGILISQPTSDEISKQFTEKRTVIQVIGPGGAGKTTFARQCGLWALMGGHPGGLRSHAMLPLWIDEDMAADNNPLTDVVKNKLAALVPDAKTDDLFLDALLKKQRLLTIVDRLSERSVSTQEYVKKIYSSTRAEAMLITTRSAVRIEGVTPIKVFPQPLNERTLLYFMQGLLQSESAENHLEPAHVSLDNQMALADKLAALYRNSVRADGNILPLPVRLFVEEAQAIIAASGSLNSLPQSVPDVYSRYLERVNPDNPSVPNFMSHTVMLRAAKLLAKLALGDDFIPKEFYAQEGANELGKEGWTDAQKVDPIQRLLDNGVLISKGEILIRRLKFVLDPIAEHLGAVAHLEEVRHDHAGFDSLRNRARHATGFLTALDLLAGRGNDQPRNPGLVDNSPA